MFSVLTNLCAEWDRGDEERIMICLKEQQRLQLLCASWCPCDLLVKYYNATKSLRHEGPLRSTIWILLILIVFQLSRISNYGIRNIKLSSQFFFTPAICPHTSFVLLGVPVTWWLRYYKMSPSHKDSKSTKSVLECYRISDSLFLPFGSL